jgi:tRNA (mo5U34)-methyltransferase
VVTPGADASALKLSALNLPADMTGLTILDVGAWNGYFSFACEQRGAKVLATDHFCWGAAIDGKRGFDFAKKTLRSQVAGG